ncbi:MAG: hypothetical protein HXY41_02195 [Chloroflexi bacterium]|nr:hypothetical protein [Chloroflexota bacterium]
MAINFNSNEFKRTLVNLAMNVMRAPEEFSSFILTEPDIQGEVNAEAMRVSLYYAMALLAYGFTPEDTALKESARWFATPFPTHQRRQMDAIEMSRLEGTLLLRPFDPSVQGRLKQLIKQRTPDGRRFEIQDPPTQYDLLWALKLLNLARRQGVLRPDMIVLEDLRESLDKAIQSEALLDKNLALALRLRFELFGGLLPEQEEKFLRGRLIHNARDNGLWDLTQDNIWLAERMRHHALTPQDIQQHYMAFWKMIQSACAVVENLSVLMPTYGVELQQVLLPALDLWWNTFNGDQSDDAAGELRVIFARRTEDYLMALSLTLIALRAFLDEPLIHRAASYVHTHVLDHAGERAASSEKEMIKKALRDFLQVEFEQPPEKLNLGLSGAKVVRIYPVVRSPLYGEETIFNKPLVIKYGPADEIRLEHENYKKLPDVLRRCFVNIPREMYPDPARQEAYVIMPDLSQFKTLYESLSILPRIYPALMKELSAFLITMHWANQYNPVPAPRGIVYDLYLQPMQQHVALIFNFLTREKLLVEDQTRQHANLLQQKLVEQLADLTRHQMRLGVFPRAYMHGDLHTRNIMISHSAPHANSEVEVAIKLIDLEKVREDGDAALDLGQLLVDVDLLLGNPDRVNDYNRPLVEIIKQVVVAYQKFARERRDTHFTARVQLARARSYIRVAKGKTRQIEQHLQNGRRGLALEITREMLLHCEQAAKHLETVLKALNQPVS